MLGIKPKTPINNYKDGYYGISRKASPLNDMTAQENDSIAAANAWSNFKAGYMNRTEHMNKPISAEQNQLEYDREKNEFYFDREEGKLKLIPTDDAEQPIQGWRDNKEDWQFAPDRISSKKETRYSTRIK